MSTAFRTLLRERGFDVHGAVDSHIVPLRLGHEGFARVAGGRAFELGVIATVIEFPVVALGAARYRFSMKPTYKDSQIRSAVELTAQAVRDARKLYELHGNEIEQVTA